MTRVTVAGFLNCRSLDEADRVAEILPEHVRLSRAEPGCLSFEIFRSSAKPTQFAVHEVFIDQAAFEAHQDRARFTEWWLRTKSVPNDLEVTGIAG